MFVPSVDRVATEVGTLVRGGTPTPTPA
jgi:hypothetical protein